MKKFLIAVAVAGSALSVGVLAQDRDNDRDTEQQANAQQQAEEEELSEEEQRLAEVVCRTEPVLGSRTRVNRTCMTRAEWNQVAEASRRGQDQMIRNAGRNQACSFSGGC